ncbi:MAG: integral membrane sensor signal transduction histidine kinase [Erysipelotrichaceae bacterium]|nr:MAG: integral membrane sensor signal transduction histidine [Erysipelotrichaceae bacterium]TXT16254.1 MAG: integral membrane sensor signal transduction histidine kinase [Erysipelotrichaceae bacterium]
MKGSLRSRLTLSIAAVALVLIAIISSLSSYFINQQFKAYITKQQVSTLNEIVYSLGQQYNTDTQTWNVEYVHTIGMYALYDGYIIKVYNESNQTVWDAEIWDMSTCIQIKEDISHQMLLKFPGTNGKFSDTDFSIELMGNKIGRVNVTYFGPYFYSDNDFDFLNQLSSILLFVAAISLLVSIILGSLIAKRISSPILKTINATSQISQGDYKIRIKDRSNLSEVDHLIESVNQLASSLDKQESLKKQLTSDVAHELRTPLTTLRITIEAMLDGILEPSPERLKSSYEEVLRITNIVKDLESLAILEDGNLKLEKADVDLVDLAHQIVKKLEHQIHEKEMVVSIKGKCPEISVDSERMTQVMINLFTNAIKYTQFQGNITIEFEETMDDVVMMVSDNGSGISQDELPFIFERFYRADKSRNRSTGGSGIGLTIVKSIVEAHGGNIQVQSEVGVGSCFIVNLPK